MRVGVMGVGAIGGILSAHLVKAGAEVIIVDVDKNILQSVKKDGLKITGPAADKTLGEFTAKPADAISDLLETGPLDFIFVCVKTTVLETVVAALKKTWRPGTTLISFQNGIDPEEMLAEVAGRDNTLRVVVNYAGHIVEHGVLSINWFNPPNFIGALTEKGRRHAEAITDILNTAGLTTEVTTDIKKYAFKKTVLNATLCPICTLTGLTMGEAMALPDTRKLVIEILKEGIVVAEKMGWKFEQTMEDWLRYLDAGGAHKTSMAEDINAGRGTEIAFMNGKICEYGAKVGVPTPYNNAMELAVLGKEDALRSRR